MMPDSTNSVPISLRLSVTDSCQFHCLYCRPEDDCASHIPNGSLLSFDDMLRFVHMLRARFTLSKIHITGGEPLTRPGIAELIHELVDMGISDLALTTNGQLLQGLAQPLFRSGLRRMNISLDSLNPETFRHITHGGDLTRTLEGIDSATACGFSPIKLNTVVIRGVNDDEVVDIAEYGLNMDCHVRFLELMPIGMSSSLFREWFVPTTEVKQRLSERYDIEPADSLPGSSSSVFHIHDNHGTSGTVGFISPKSDPFCGDCGRLRLSSGGRLMGCLTRRDSVDIAPLFSGDEAQFDPLLFDAVNEALSMKYNGQRFTVDESMHVIGG